MVYWENDLRGPDDGVVRDRSERLRFRYCSYTIGFLYFGVTIWGLITLPFDLEWVDSVSINKCKTPGQLH
jgi:hypothetical protein